MLEMMHRCLFCPEVGDWELALSESGPSLTICARHFFPYLVVAMFVASGGSAPVVRGPRISHAAVMENARRWARHYLGIATEQAREQRAAVDEVESMLAEAAVTSALSPDLSPQERVAQDAFRAFVARAMVTYGTEEFGVPLTGEQVMGAHDVSIGT